MQDVELDLGGAGGVLAYEGVGLDELDMVFLGHTHIKDTLQ